MRGSVVDTSEEVWDEIRVANAQLSEITNHLREAAAEARQAADTQPERSGLLRLEMLQNLKTLADQVRDILWRELQLASGQPAASADSTNRAAELFALLGKIAAAQGDVPSRSFFEEIETTVDRTLNHAYQPDPGPSKGPRYKAA